MRIRYQTHEPAGIWYLDLEGKLSRNRQEAMKELIHQCQDHFGVQFFRYDHIIISIMQGSEPLVSFAVDPQQWFEDMVPIVLAA
jgi:hypothetical protein